MIDNQTKMVKDFHRVMGQPVLLSPQVPGNDRLLLRGNLLLEEDLEFLQASGREVTKTVLKHHTVIVVSNDIVNTPDLVQMADALIDSQYINKGSIVELGLHSIESSLFEEVQRSNMSKLDPETGRPIKREDGKVLKPPTWTPPDLKSIIDNFISLMRGTDA